MSPRVFASCPPWSPADLLLRPLSHLCLSRASCSGAAALRVSALGACGYLPRMGDGVNAPALTVAIWRLARGAARAAFERPLKATPWHDTLCDLDVWESMRATVASVRPLTPAEAAMDCRALARGGLLPPRGELAARWRWEGAAGGARARRLAESLEWLDQPLAKWNGL